MVRPVVWRPAAELSSAADHNRTAGVAPVHFRTRIFATFPPDMGNFTKAAWEFPPIYDDFISRRLKYKDIFHLARSLQ